MTPVMHATNTVMTHNWNLEKILPIVIWILIIQWIIIYDMWPKVNFVDAVMAIMMFLLCEDVVTNPNLYQPLVAITCVKPSQKSDRVTKIEMWSRLVFNMNCQKNIDGLAQDRYNFIVLVFLALSHWYVPSCVRVIKVYIIDVICINIPGSTAW